MVDQTQDLAPPATITATFFGYLLSTVTAVVDVFEFVNSKQALLSALHAMQTPAGPRADRAAGPRMTWPSSSLWSCSS
jgi:hypothetical protein